WVCSDTVAGVNPGNGVGQKQREIGGIATPGNSLFNPKICPNGWVHLSQYWNLGERDSELIWNK
ncbi:MAG: hypothetical protein ABF665_18055, partial [Gluconacetobacter sp.]